MKTNINDKEIDALFQKLLPPEEYGEDSNVEELYNRIMDMETELEKFKVSPQEPTNNAPSEACTNTDVSGRSEQFVCLCPRTKEDNCDRKEPCKECETCPHFRQTNCH
jgi:hypothetical protein